jgi:hypothetical protein
MTATIPTGDPFAGVESNEPLPRGDLEALIGQEAELDAGGVSCEMKDEDWSHPSCATCPVRPSVRQGSGLSKLCSVGVAQQAALAAGTNALAAA